MRLSARILAILLFLFVFGCATHAERCVDYGFKKGTDAFAGCIQREDIAERARRNRMGSAIVGGSIARPSSGPNVVHPHR